MCSAVTIKKSTMSDVWSLKKRTSVILKQRIGMLQTELVHQCLDLKTHHISYKPPINL